MEKRRIKWLELFKEFNDWADPCPDPMVQLLGSDEAGACLTGIEAAILLVLKAEAKRPRRPIDKPG